MKNIHFVGIKGVGVAPLAIIAKEAGFVVSGCDIAEEFITDSELKKAGITVFEGFSTDHVENVDMVITTGAHGGFDNPEVKTAKEKGIPVVTQGEAVGMFMKGEIFNRKQVGISVTGSHGKTTTTAMIAAVFTTAGIDPSFIIGTGHGHFGKGKYFIAEADEYANEPKYDKTPKLLLQHPIIAVITNIEHDHPDVYESVDDVRKTFLQFAKQVPKNGLLIICGDDPQSQKLLTEYGGPRATYGFEETHDFVIKNIKNDEHETIFSLTHKGKLLGQFSLVVMGEHNMLNATAAYIASDVCGLPIDSIQKGLKAFTGSKRRAEFIGRLTTGALLYDDYAHHPTEIAKTLSGFTKRFPTKKIVCVFQPHTYSRTKALFDDFVHAFKDADTVILVDIYASLREEQDLSVSSALLASKMKELHSNVLYMPKLLDVVEYIDKMGYKDDTILITMGAGDVYKISEKLWIQNYKN